MRIQPGLTGEMDGHGRRARGPLPTSVWGRQRGWGQGLGKSRNSHWRGWEPGIWGTGVGGRFKLRVPPADAPRPTVEQASQKLATGEGNFTENVLKGGLVKVTPLGPGGARPSGWAVDSSPP